MSERLKIILIVLGFLIVAGIAGNSDYEDAKREEQAYCDSAKAGESPAYRDDIDCAEVDHAQ